MRFWMLLLPLVLITSLGAAPSGFTPYGIKERSPWATSHVQGSPEPPLPYRVRKAFPNLSIFQPIFVRTEPGSHRLIAVQHMGHWVGPGKLVRFENDPEVSKYEVFLELDRLIYGFTFHPKFKENGYIYLVTNGPSLAKNKQNRVSRFTIDRKDPHTIVPGSELTILEWDSNGHNGGDLAFGPDGYLYIPTGDGTSDSDENNSGQDLVDLCAVMIRIDVDHPDQDKPYSVPKDNPFVKTPGARPEIWAYGFRNPWRMDYDHKSNQLWVGQNGQDVWEQVLLVHRGDNFGWSVTEGGYPFFPERKPGPTPIVKPIVDHPHSEFRSLTGGVVYRGDKLPELDGTFIYGDFSTGRIWGVRHDGEKVTFNAELADTPFQIVGFAVDEYGELIVVDQGTGFHYLEKAPADQPRPPFPTKLSETGLFASVAGHKTSPGLVPYSVNSPLWSDGAYKERYIAIPSSGQIELRPNRGWHFEDGAVLVKSFALEGKAGDPSSRRYIETRLLLKEQGEWIGYSYEWNREQTEATLVPAAGADRTFTVRDVFAAGGKRQQKWHYPSRAECMVCHSRAANYVLGLSTLQMNKVHDYDGVSDQQLRTLEHLGLFKVNVLEHEQTTNERYNRVWNQLWSGPIDELFSLTGLSQEAQGQVWSNARTVWKIVRPGGNEHLNAIDAWWREGRKNVQAYLRKNPQFTTLLPKWPGEYPRMVDPSDTSAELADRARSYLHANCSICHVPAGGGNAPISVEYNTARKDTKLYDAMPVHHTFGLKDARVVASGDPGRSTLLHRMNLRGQGQMPPLASSMVDTGAVELIRQWIAGMGEEARGDRPQETGQKAKD